jgi:hypothetical protein
MHLLSLRMGHPVTAHPGLQLLLVINILWERDMNCTVCNYPGRMIHALVLMVCGTKLHGRCRRPDAVLVEMKFHGCCRPPPRTNIDMASPARRIPVCMKTANECWSAICPSPLCPAVAGNSLDLIRQPWERVRGSWGSCARCSFGPAVAWY